MPPDDLALPVTSVRVLGANSLAAVRSDWDRLALSALEENAFYAPAYVLAGLDHVDRKAEFRALCAFRRQPDGRERLAGFWPLRRTRFRYGLPHDVEIGAQNCFQTSGAPLLDRQHAGPVLDALLGAAQADPGVAASLLVPNIRRVGPFARLVAERAGALGLRYAFTNTLGRPVLWRRDESAESYFARSLAPKRLRELRRTHRRLSEQGSLTFRHVRNGPELGDAVEDFLRIELAGWKGTAGTALLSRPETASFGRAAFTGRLADGPIGSADVLALDGRAIAVSLNLQVGRTCFAIKCAYDETLRRFSPGLVLEYLVIEHLFEARFADEIDSCVTQEGHVIQDLWDGTAEVGTLALWPEQARLRLGPLAFDLAGLEGGRVRIRAKAKGGYIAAREMIGSATGLVRPGLAAAQAQALRQRLDARTRKAMMTFNAAQPNGEFAAVLASII